MNESRKVETKRKTVGKKVRNTLFGEHILFEGSQVMPACPSDKEYCDNEDVWVVSGKIFITATAGFLFC
jgi:hypothetical protein